MHQYEHSSIRGQLGTRVIGKKLFQDIGQTHPTNDVIDDRHCTDLIGPQCLVAGLRLKSRGKFLLFVAFDCFRLFSFRHEDLLINDK